MGVISVLFYQKIHNMKKEFCETTEVWKVVIQNWWSKENKEFSTLSNCPLVMT